jgi:Ca2+:H+ antiporter
MRQNWSIEKGGFLVLRSLTRVTREGVLASLRFLMLAFLPIAAILLYFVHSDPVWIFVTGAIAVAALADWVRRATEQVAAHAGPAIGGLVTVSFGSIAELLLAFFVLTSSDAAVVRAQIVGSIIGTSLLGLGLAMFAGGMKFERQKFERVGAGRRSSMLILVMVALLLPAIFDLAAARPGQHHASPIGNEELSLAISVVLLLLYAGGLVYTLVTRRDVFSSEKEEVAGGTNWSLTVALAVLVGATAAIAFGAEMVAGALQATAQNLGLPLLFLGVVPLALIGTSSDLLAAVTFGRQNRMSLVMSICVGSAIQVALVIAPLLVLASWAIGRPMTLVFSNPLDLFAIAGTVFVVNAISSDGETNWFEGLLLIGVYVLLAMAFFFMGST